MVEVYHRFITYLDRKRGRGQQPNMSSFENWTIDDQRRTSCVYGGGVMPGQVLASAMPRAENRAAMVQLYCEDDTFFPSRYIIYLWGVRSRTSLLQNNLNLGITTERITVGQMNGLCTSRSGFWPYVVYLGFGMVYRVYIYSWSSLENCVHKLQTKTFYAAGFCCDL